MGTKQVAPKRVEVLRVIARAQANARLVAGGARSLDRHGEAAAWEWLGEWYESLASLVNECGVLRQPRLFH